MPEPLRIASVFSFPNGMVVVCDQHGQQMPEYQGKKEEVVDKIEEIEPLAGVMLRKYKTFYLELFRVQPS